VKKGEAMGDGLEKGLQVDSGRGGVGAGGNWDGCAVRSHRGGGVTHFRLQTRVFGGGGGGGP